jgi:glycine/D-amino acid oxidase-like deaminating enzyme
MSEPGAASLWNATLPADARVARPALGGDVDADIAIVGAGYTGLWTAYSLKRADPTLRIVVCERETVGFGASGRNGGWCSALFAGSRRQTAREHGRAAVVEMQRAMFATLDEIERVIDAEGIDCDWARGGTIQVATIAAHRERLHKELEDHRAWGFGADDYRELSESESREMIGCRPNLGGLFTPHCAAIHPAKLAHGLGRAVERAGVTIYENTTVESIEPGRLRTNRGDVRAEIVVRATEAFSPDLPGLRRTVAPIFSLMIATEPLSDAFWAGAALATRPTFADFRHMIIYGQRTADGRFAFGGRGTPYHFGSRVRAQFDTDPRVFSKLHATLRGLFPELGDAAITHQWGGAVAVPRDWYPSVGFDRTTGIAWAGGYVGDGVSTTNLAGRTIADLMTGRDTELVHLPWVGHHSPRWEVEPLRWLGVNVSRKLVESIDRAEAVGREAKWRQGVAERLLGEPARALDKMQNSLPSGSASTTHDCSPWPMSTCVAPWATRRATSASRSSGRKSRWSRSFTTLGSGTRMNSNPGTCSGVARISNSSESSAKTIQPNASAHQRPSATGSCASTTICSQTRLMRPF